MKKNDKITRTCFLAKYGGLSLYDFNFGKRCSIDDEYIHFVKGYGYALIGKQYNPEELQLIMNILAFMMTCLKEY